MVAARRKVDPKPDDPYRGVYTDERDIDSLLAHGGSVARRPPANPVIDAARTALAEKAAVLRQSGTRLRLDDMAEAFGLEASMSTSYWWASPPTSTLLSKSSTAT